MQMDETKSIRSETIAVMMVERGGKLNSTRFIGPHEPVTTRRDIVNRLTVDAN